MTITTMQRVKIGDITMPIGLHSIILQRFLKEKDLRALWDAYEGAKLKSFHAARPPTELQVKMAKMVKSGKRTRETATAFNVSYAVVQNAVNRVAVWEFINGGKK